MPSNRNARNTIRLALLLTALATMAGCAASPRSRLTQTTDAFATAMDTIASARDAGLVTDEQVQRTKPIADAFWAAKRKADEQLAAGNATGAKAFAEQMAAAVAELQPLISEILAKKGKK